MLGQNLLYHLRLIREADTERRPDSAAAELLVKENDLAQPVMAIRMPIPKIAATARVGLSNLIFL